MLLGFLSPCSTYRASLLNFSSTKFLLEKEMVVCVCEVEGTFLPVLHIGTSKATFFQDSLPLFPSDPGWPLLCQHLIAVSPQVSYKPGSSSF